MINDIIRAIRIHGAPTTKKKWIERVNEVGWLNIDLPIPKLVSGYGQVIERYDEDSYLLRLFENHYESFRIWFNEEDIVVLKQKWIGRSGVQAFLPAVRQMGYHEAEQPYKWQSKIIDNANYFKYIDLSKSKMCAIRLIEYKNIRYAAELLIKRGYYKLAEIYVNETPFVDIRKCIKNQPLLLKKPSVNKVKFAEHCNFKYKRGMFKYDPYQLSQLMKVITWEKWKKQDYDIIDYLDYREHNRKWNLPDFPKDLQVAKEQLQVYKDKEKYKEENKLIKKRKLPTFNVGGYVIIAPKSSTDLLENGKQLHHCVYNYTKLYATGKLDLYIVREDNNDKATIEVKKGKVVQCRGKHNKDLTNELNVIIERIEEHYERGNQ